MKDPMLRIEAILSPLYRNGELTFGEVVAILGAVCYMAERCEDDPVRQDWVESYGTLANEALSNLNKVPEVA